MRLDIDVSDLMRFSRTISRRSQVSQAAITRALSQVGDGVVNQVARSLSQETGLHQEEVMALIKVRKSKNYYDIIMPKSLVEPGEQPFGGKRKVTTKRGDFATGQLVNVITREDDKVCPKCEEIAEGSPYTLEDARTLIPHHPHCRCLLESFRYKRRLPVTMSTMAPSSGNKNLSLSLQQLADRVRNEVKVSIRTGR